MHHGQKVWKDVGKHGCWHRFLGYQIVRYNPSRYSTELGQTRELNERWLSALQCWPSDQVCCLDEDKVHYSLYKYGPLRSSACHFRLGWQTISKLNIKIGSSFLVGEKCMGPFFLRFLFIFLPWLPLAEFTGSIDRSGHLLFGGLSSIWTLFVSRVIICCCCRSWRKCRHMTGWTWFTCWIPVSQDIESGGDSTDT